MDVYDAESVLRLSSANVSMPAKESWLDKVLLEITGLLLTLALAKIQPLHLDFLT